MKNLGNLTPSANSNKNTKRIGRGIGSGTGKTAGKGHKGQKARKGGGIAPGFEGGQTPLYRRLPKYGFSNEARGAKFHVFNLADFNSWTDGETVSVESLVRTGLLKKAKYPVKVLGGGEFSKKLVFQVSKLSKSAREKVLENGGEIKEK